MADYPGVSSWFDVVGTAEVSCTTYAQLHSDGRAPAPDIIKIDVQGLEYEVLTGFGDLLENCIGIELESHVYPLYHGQKMLADLIPFLADRGLKLAKMQSQGWFEGTQLEFNAWFLKDPAWLRGKPANTVAKYLLTRKVLSL